MRSMPMSVSHTWSAAERVVGRQNTRACGTRASAVGSFAISIANDLFAPSALMAGKDAYAPGPAPPHCPTDY